MEGWIKLHRKMLENPVVCKDPDHVTVWVYLLLNATHKEYPAMFKGKKIALLPGQLITGRKAIANDTGVNETKVWRILELFKSDQQIEQQASNKNSLITIVNWDYYQNCEQQNEREMSDSCAGNEQEMSTNKNVKKNKNVKNERNVYIASQTAEIIQYLNENAGTKYKTSSKKTQTCIQARLSEGYTIEDFKTVIEKKCSDWIGTDYEQYLRPETLFGTKFESYLNAKIVKGNGKAVNGNEQKTWATTADFYREYMEGGNS